MPFDLIPLLIHSEAVPARARAALRAATAGTREHRHAHMELAARVIMHETDLDCRNTHDLLGLSGECR